MLQVLLLLLALGPMSSSGDDRGGDPPPAGGAPSPSTRPVKAAKATSSAKQSTLSLWTRFKALSPSVRRKQQAAETGPCSMQQTSHCSLL